ncbi:glycosyltransferase [Cohnella sp. GCM10027633]|uniref:glycosyltransferase n=1 Tax=unclassified Cohnella TaxID=2636738 RepID=UPI0036390932
MNIVHVNNTDLSGRRFNGHDLQLSLNEQGHRAHQLVVEKQGNEVTTVSLLSPHELFVRSSVRGLEQQLSLNNLLFPFGKKIAEHPIITEADIVHYHLIHNHFISLFDYPELFGRRPSVWTVHDPWTVTGHCVHPRECTGWQNGCHHCPQLDDSAFPMQVDKASQMWEIKRRVYQNMDVHVVVASRFMESYIRTSPLTSHLTNIYRIPFGIDVDVFSNRDREAARQRWAIPIENFVIAFRAETNENKGLHYILEMLEKLSAVHPVTLLVIGNAHLPSELMGKYHVIELGWSNDQFILYDFYAACTVFLMPSIAESFGLMAIEAMASGRPIIVFENTVLEEITFAPECGFAVPYKNSDMLRDAVEWLMHHPEECDRRGTQGRELAAKYYRYEDYVRRHITLYEDIQDKRRESDSLREGR